jgi:tetratricopeptide (TPR) repeat protein
MFFYGFIATIFLTILAGVPATAQTYDQLRDWCYKSNLNNPAVNNSEFNNQTLAAQNIQGCDAVITSGRENQVNLTIALNERGWAYITTGQYARALQDYDRVIQLNPDNVLAISNRCFARALIGRYQEALADCNEALRRVPVNAEKLDTRAFTYLKSGQFDMAIADYTAALKIKPEKASSLYGRGLAHRKKGEIAVGDADISAAKAIQGDIDKKLAKYGVNPN